MVSVGRPLLFRSPSLPLQRVLREELGEEWREQLQEFDSRPLAAASIGQVHRAVMLDGKEVAMKIQVRRNSSLGVELGTFFLLKTTPPIVRVTGAFVGSLVEFSQLKEAACLRELWLALLVIGTLYLRMCLLRCCSTQEWLRASTATLTTSWAC